MTNKFENLNNCKKVLNKYIIAFGKIIRYLLQRLCYHYGIPISFIKTSILNNKQIWNESHFRYTYKMYFYIRFDKYLNY